MTGTPEEKAARYKRARENGCYFLLEHRADGATVPHALEHEGKYRFFVEGRANTSSVFEPCGREEFERFAGFGAFVHPCGGPRKWIGAR